MFRVLLVVAAVVVCFHTLLVMSEDAAIPRIKTVSLLHTYEDSIETNGEQIIFHQAGPVNITSGLEFPEYNGEYDIDVKLRRIQVTLVDNSAATDLIVPEGRADRYYFSFHRAVAYAEVVESNLNTLVASTTILEPGFSLDSDDGTGTGIETPVVFPKGGFALTVGSGTDFSELGQTLTIDYALGKPNTPPCLIDSFVLWNTDDDVVVDLLEDEIDLCELGFSNYTLQAAAPCAKKVKFTLSDQDEKVVITNYTDESLPFTLGGEGDDSEFIPVAALSEVGSYKIKARTIPRSQPMTKNFEVVNDCVL